MAHAVVGDLSEQKTIDQVVATALAQFGGVDVLVNNAGIMDDMSAAADVADAVWERVLRVNLTAPFLLTRAVLPHLLVAGRGSIVFTASEASLRGSAAGTAYTVSKHGIAGLTKSLAVMYRDQGIHVNAIAPDCASRLPPPSGRSATQNGTWPSFQRGVTGGRRQQVPRDRAEVWSSSVYARVHQPISYQEASRSARRCLSGSLL